MIAVRPAEARGRFDFGWLDTRHTFSFGEYHDPQHMGFRALRVINEDRVQPDAGFPPHPHRDMEIVTYILQGAVAHRDSMGNGSVIRPGDVQRMSAGTGVVHSEYNASRDEPLHLLQIWILPERTDLEPEYEQKAFPAGEKRGRLRLLVSPDGAAGSVRIHQDARLHGSLLDAGQAITHPLAAGRHAWVQVARGALSLNGTALGPGDGAAIRGEPALRFEASADSEFLLFDLA
jgi:redox-sensitive bicupin YhaK (pirin superfamily)